MITVYFEKRYPEVIPQFRRRLTAKLRFVLSLVELAGTKDGGGRCDPESERGEAPPGLRPGPRGGLGGLEPRGGGLFVSRDDRTQTGR